MLLYLFYLVTLQQKACFYLVMKHILDSDETQKNGVVSVLYGIDKRSKEKDEFPFPAGDRFLMSVGGGFSSVPMRVTGFHFLWNDQRIQPFMALMRHALGRFVNARFKSHFGTIEECHQQLELYGIPSSAIPLDMNGIISNTKTFRWIKKYETKEAWPDAIDWSHAVCLPLASDVLLGRG